MAWFVLVACFCAMFEEGGCESVAYQSPTATRKTIARERVRQRDQLGLSEAGSNQGQWDSLNGGML